MGNTELKKKAGLSEIFLSFFKIGAFTFGGGYAMIPLILREVVEKKEWVGEKEALDIIAIAQSCPGVLAINASTFVGNRVAGFWGGAVATLGTVLPSYITILAVTFFYNQFRSNTWVAYGFQGIRAAVGVLLIQSVASLYKSASPNIWGILLMAAVFAAVAFLSISTAYVIIAVGAAGFAVGAYNSWRENKEGKNG